MNDTPTPDDADGALSATQATDSAVAQAASTRKPEAVTAPETDPSPADAADGSPTKIASITQGETAAS